jgi:hypothetical protein
MSGLSADAARGLTVDRTWETRTDDDQNLVWSVDEQQGFVQGPLELAFLCDKHLTLNLDDGQLALSIRSGQLEAVFLPGSHHLAVGTGDGALSPEGQLIFLLTEFPIHLRWREGVSIHVAKGDGQLDRLSVIGSCTCVIDGPADFWRCFLAGTDQIGEEFIRKVIDALVRSRLEALVADLVEQGMGGTAAAQARLLQLTPEEFGEELYEYGLDCAQIAVYTAAPPVEESISSVAGQFRRDGDYGA